jgi:hypothetical protein
MHRRSIFAAIIVAGIATTASAQQPAAGIKPSDVAGVWDAKSMVGPNDSVVATSVLTATADTSGWTMKLEGRDPIAMRVVAMGGDSIVTEAGPYPSILRAGLTVTVLRNVSHYKGDTMWGTFEALYSSGDKFSGKVTATRRK